MDSKWKLMYEGPRLSHLLAKHIFLHPYFSRGLRKMMNFQDDNFLWYSDTEENLHGGYYTEEDMAKAKKYGHAFFSDEEKFAEWIKNQDELHKQAKALMEEHKFEKRINKISKEKILKLIPEKTKIRSDLFVYVLSCQPQCTEGLADELKELIKAKVKDKEEAKEVFIKLTAPEKKSFFSNEEIDWLDIVIKARNGKKVTKLVKKHYDKYFLIPASDRTEPWDYEHFTKLLKQSLESDEDFEKKREELHGKYENSIKIKKEIVRKHKLSKKTKELGSKIAEIGYYRFLTSFYGRWIGYYLVLTCKKFAPELGLTFEELSSCEENELIALLSGEKSVTKDELSKRALAQTILIKDGHIQIHYGEEAIQVKKAELGEIDYESIREVKGEIANLGKVRGKAFVFYWNDDINKKIHEIPKNAIIVAPQTHPTYMPAIRKCKGLAVDEGGITGHASIVSRELNKPCVIGLHHITKVVKTGDLIEIDGDTGVVRVLEKKKEKKTWQLMSEGPRLSHFFMSIIWSEVFKGKYHAKYTRGYQTPDFVWFSSSDEGLHAEYRTKEWIKKAEDIGLKNFLDEEYFHEYIKEIDKWISKANEIELSFSREYSKEELKELVPDMLEIYKQLIGSIFSNWPEYTNGLSEKLKKKVKSVELFEKLTHPETMSNFTLEELDFLELVIRIKTFTDKVDNKSIKKYPFIKYLLREHYKKYWLLSASDRTNPWTKEELLVRINEFLKSNKDPRERRNKLITKYGQILDEKREILSEQNFDRETKIIASRIATIGHYRFKASFAWRRLGYFFVTVFKRFAEKENVSFEEMSSLTVQELLDYLKGKNIHKLVPELKRRAEAELYYVENHKPHFFFGKEAIEKKNKIIGKQNYDLKIIKGEVGSKGYAKGRAFVFTWNDSIEEKLPKMPKDSILVVPQTHPALLPIIRNANAIVTDEGGITGHAAIVARELGKPCVIGTHIGTKVIKQNDLIEVNANKGIVKILEFTK
ncbi:MAG: PEP-utilizing enzyme [archaeon]